jgi:hypothetical protein
MYSLHKELLLLDASLKAGYYPALNPKTASVT